MAFKLLDKMLFPTTIQDLCVAINMFTSSMKEGNIVYDRFDLSPCQPILEVRDVTQRLGNLDMQIHQDEGFFEINELKVKLEELLLQHQPTVGVLIVPPDKSMTIYIKDGQIGLMDGINMEDMVA